MKVALVESQDGWQFVDSRGRVVRLDPTAPRDYSTKGDAMDAAAKFGYDFSGSELTVS